MTDTCKCNLKREKVEKTPSLFSNILPARLQLLSHYSPGTGGNWWYRERLIILAVIHHSVRTWT